MFTHLAALVLLLPPFAPDLRPVTVSVVDGENGAPVTEFVYQAWYDAPGVRSPPNGDEWTRVASPAGTFEIQAPPSCRLGIMARAPDYIGGYPMLNEFTIKATDEPRRVVVRLRRGITVRGTVRDSQTKEPIAGATVAPFIHLVPLWMPDEEKQVKTGGDGRYEVRGVDPKMGVSATHPDYIHDRDFPDGKSRVGPNHEVFLQRGVTLTVKVVDTDGKPLEGATAIGEDDKLVSSTKDGRLVVRNAGLNPVLLVGKDGFISRWFDADQVRRESSKPGGIVAVLEPLIELTGRVVAPGGQPVAAFTVVAGPGEHPSTIHCVRREIEDRDGRFSLGLSKSGKTWVGVAAEGSAAWEGWVEVRRGGGPLEVRLSPGVSVSGRVEVPERLRDRVKARLVPRRDNSDIGGVSAEPYAEQLPTRRAALEADGTLCFDHVRPDRYRLILEGRGVPGTALALDVPDAGLDVGTVRIDVPTATGRVEGRVWHPKEKGGEPWAFAKGYIGGFWFEGLGDENDQGIVFQADEGGRFKVDRVPAGLTTVGFPYQVFDVINSHTWNTLVVEGQTTTVRAFEPEGRREFTLAFAIGDGSEAQYQSGTGLGAARKVDNVTVSSRMFAAFDKKEVTPRTPTFRVALTPVSKGPLSFAHPGWEELDAQRKVVLPDVGPGAYRMRAYDWFGSRDQDTGPLFDREVVVTPGGRGEVKIELGAGCITGKIPRPKNIFERPVAVTAVAQGARSPARRGCCDFDGNFCILYLSPGTYSVFIHDPGSD